MVPGLQAAHPLPGLLPGKGPYRRPCGDRQEYRALMLRLREFRTALKGLADLLPWAAMIDPGIVLNKDASLTTAYFFRGKDMASATPQELDALAVQANAALAKLGTGWMIHVDSIRTPIANYPAPEDCHFPDRVTRFIDDERRAQNNQDGARFDSVYALAITYLPPSELQNKVTALFVVDEDRKSNQVDYNAILQLYKSQVHNITDGLGAVIDLRPMSSGELLTYLHLCVTGLDHPVSCPPIPMYLDAVLASRDFYGGLAPRIGGKHIRPITVHGFPGDSLPGILDRLNQLPFSYRWSTRFIALDQVDAEKRLKSYRMQWWKKRLGIGGLIKSATGGDSNSSWQNSDAVEMAQDADQAITENSQGQVHYGIYSTTILIMEDDAKTADANAREVVKLLSNTQFPSFVEDMNAVEVYLGSLPANGWANIRRPMMNTLNLAHLMPLTAVWAGHATHPAPEDMYPPGSPPLLIAATAGSTPLRLCLHVGDLGHFAVLGPPGAGKSTLLALLVASHFRYPRAQAFCFDYGYSMFALCEAAGGAHFDIGADNAEVAFCPLAQIDTPADRAWAAQYVELLVTLRLPAGQGLSISQQNEISDAIARLAAGTTSANQRTMTNFRSTVQNQELKEALKHYTLDGSLGFLLDSDHDPLIEAGGRLFVFETKHLFELDDRAIIPVLMHIFRQVEKRLDRSKPTIIPIDEAWKPFSHPLALERYKNWLKTARKENDAFGLATQNLPEILNSPLAAVVLDNVATKFLLPNPEAATQNLAPFYRSIGCNDTEIHLLANGRPKRDYYLTNADGRRLFQLRLGPVALAFVAVSGEEPTRVIRALKAEHGSDWILHWLRQRGVPAEWVEYWRGQSSNSGTVR
ncbi:MAG: hypothetical protein F8N15_05460 [Methanobacterium sp.]|nr:hypothetical protein [Methanobacterium sp.]